MVFAKKRWGGGHNKLAMLFKKWGSDKAANDFYNTIYANIFKEAGVVKKIFEIGLGTNNTDIVSNMGENGKSGASLRAFRDYLPRAEIYGADFDRRVLFQEDRIKTYFLDQTSLETFEQISDKLGVDFDLMIDDGLHSLSANLHSLNFFLTRLRIGGYAVIEDINPLAEPLYLIVNSLILKNYVCNFINQESNTCFVVKRIF